MATLRVTFFPLSVECSSLFSSHCSALRPMLQVSQLPFCRTHNWNIFRGTYTTIQIHFQHITSRTFHPPTENMTADKKSWSAVSSRMIVIMNGMYQSVLPLQNIETTFKHFMQGQSFYLKILQQQAVYPGNPVYSMILKL